MITLCMHQYHSSFFDLREPVSLYDICQSLSLQIEQEMDLVLSKRYSFKQALQSWKDIWVPTLLEYGSHLHENIYDSAQKMFEGILVVNVKDCLPCVNPLDTEAFIHHLFQCGSCSLSALLVWRSKWQVLLSKSGPASDLICVDSV